MDEKGADISKNGFKLISKYRAVIMGLAAIWIHNYHVWIHTVRDPATGFGVVLSNVESYIVTIGNCGVDIFFLMSGIGLTYAIRKNPLRKFYYRRIRRVYFPFLITAVLSAVFEKWSLTTFLGNASGYSFYAKDINSYCWFVPAVITIYLFFPLYYLVFNKTKKKLVCTVVALLVWLLLNIMLTDIMRFDLFGFYNRIPVFLIGIFFGYMAQSREDLVFTAKHYVLLILVFIASLVLLYIYKFRNFSLLLKQEKLVVPNIPLAVSYPFLVSKLMDIIERRIPKFGRILNSILSFWGKISLEMYLIYTCFLVTFFAPTVLYIRSYKVPPFAINLIVFAITSMLAWILYLACGYFWKLVELPGKRRESAGS